MQHDLYECIARFYHAYQKIIKAETRVSNINMQQLTGCMHSEIKPCLCNANRSTGPRVPNIALQQNRCMLSQILPPRSPVSFICNRLLNNKILI